MRAIVVLTTAGTEDEANRLATELVSRRLAACVNIVPIQRSVYLWQGRICQDSEFLLLVKSVESAYQAVERTIRELHSYELPEVLCLDVARGEEGFLGWLGASVDAGSET